MIKNSTLYHRFWYIRKRNVSRVHTYIRLLTIFIILAFFVIYANKSLLPVLADISEFKARSLVTMAVNDAVNEVFAGNVRYEDLVVVKEAEDGRTRSIEIDRIKLNKLSSDISSSIRERLLLLEDKSISVPFGALLGNTPFEGSGPDLHVKIEPAGIVEVGFESEFSTAGINQTRHRIYLQVRSAVDIIAPLGTKRTELTNSILIAEAMIVGGISREIG